MAIEQAREFIKRVKGDPDLLKQAASFKTKEERQQWVKGLGYSFTSEELQQASAELTDEELELVAGSNCCGYTCEVESGGCRFDNCGYVG